MEAGFIRVVEVGQYFMTKYTGDFKQFRSVACREHTLPRDDPVSQPKGWIQGNMRIGRVLEVTYSFQYGKHGIEIRIWSVERTNTWSIQITTIQKLLQIHMKIKRHKQVSRLLQSDQRQKQNHNREYSLEQQQPYQYMKEDALILSHQNHWSIPMNGRKWIDIEPAEQTLSAYDLSKKVISLLRHN